MRLVRALIIPTFLCLAAFACQRAPELDVTEVAAGAVANAESLAVQLATYSPGDAESNPMVWNEVIATLASSRSGVTRVEVLDDDVRAVVLEDGEFSPVALGRVTAVQFSDATGAAACHVVGSSGPAVVQGPCR